ncbi:hypothetical protein J4G48_0006500 [Bradyrhizobium barranii subsp. apii]|uniref:hypothetical protein n=1 Tax=Bradyrhizobium barranii TaxID=2992140 RepID=UPI001AA0BDAB|nr:hypothetical protein [Bradyrhizobium barranii]UPT97741.1 hypothetical protein J4G48_0006500 [Bradyrhizobium barranii subsp. apii]
MSKRWAADGIMSGQLPPRPGKTKAFDLLASVAAFAREHAIALNDPSLVERFIADAGPKLKEALVDPTLIHGWRTERLFEATVLSLGRFRLLKTEDAGRVHAVGTFRAPDFRVVLDEGEQWLVEVKNVRIRDPFKQETRMSAAYLASLQAYADMVGTPVKLAIFWSLWNIWTVISPDRFRTQNGGLRVTMKDAVLANESERLGEVIIMTKPPLRLVLGAATDMPRSLSPEGLANFIIGSAKLFSGDVELTDPRDRKLAEVLLFYGEWSTEGPLAVTDGGEFAGVEFVATPEEPSDQGWDGIGWASRIFSRYYAAQTIDGDQVIQLHGEAAPEWFAPLSDWDFKNSKLPLLLGRVQAPDDRAACDPELSV